MLLFSFDKSTCHINIFRNYNTDSDSKIWHVKGGEDINEDDEASRFAEETNISLIGELTKQSMTKDDNNLEIEEERELGKIIMIIYL